MKSYRSSQGEHNALRLVRRVFIRFARLCSIFVMPVYTYVYTNIHTWYIQNTYVLRKKPPIRWCGSEQKSETEQLSLRCVRYVAVSAILCSAAARFPLTSFTPYGRNPRHTPLHSSLRRHSFSMPSHCDFSPWDSRKTHRKGLMYK